MFRDLGGARGGGGGDPGGAPRASVALTAQQWSAVTLAISHGVATVTESKKLPLAVISKFTRDIAEATQEIAKRLEDEARRRGAL